jgi:small ligand-binding sensory domain FIST
MALALAAAQIDARRADLPGFSPSLGWLYLTEALAPRASALLEELRQRWPGVTWVGGAAAGLCATGVEYLEEPALVLLLTDLPAGSFRVFHGRQPLDGSRRWGGALVHADPALPDLAELVAELAERVGGQGLFGGLTSSRASSAQWAGEVIDGGLSGVAFAPGVRLLSRVSQGCWPLGPPSTVTATDGPLVLSLDREPALDALLAEVGGGVLTVQQAPDAGLIQRLRNVLVGLTPPGLPVLDQGGSLSVHTLVRPMIGVDPARRALALTQAVEPGWQLCFCRRDATAARRDLVRLCAEIREEVEGDGADDALAAHTTTPAARLLGAIYISCLSRGGAHFGGPSAELQIVRQALGEVPLVGFFAGGEIAGPHLHSHSGVLSVLVSAE